jgi:tRNA(Arg) A34 adenosine deaminase TadA
MGVNTNCCPQQLAIDLIRRSSCRVQVAAVISDGAGIFAWGWNNSGRHGLGEHAEAMAIRRANPKRFSFDVWECTMYVAAVRNGNIILAKPCEECMKIIKARDLRNVYYTTKDGWKSL